MNRTRQREQLFKLLFRVEFNNSEEMEEQADLFLFLEENPEIPEDVQPLIKERAAKIVPLIEEIDSKLKDKITGWDISRIGKVELTILRLAVYEIEYDESVPASVAINEAVELAKKYGQDSSSSFINGVLAKFTK